MKIFKVLVISLVLLCANVASGQSFQINPFTGKLDANDPASGVTESGAAVLTNKTIDGDNNTISNLAHGAEVDNPTTAHGATGAVVGTTNVQTLTNKTIAAGVNTLSGLTHGSEVDNPSSGVHGVTGSVVGTTDTQTLTGKTVNLTDNTVTGTIAEFNTAVSDDTIVTPSSTSTLTNKTIDADGTGNVISNIDIGNAIAASQAEAEAGTDNTKLVTSLRVSQAITALAGSSTDVSALQTNVGLNFFLDSVDHTRSVQNLQDGYVDQFEDQTGVDDLNSLNESYDATNDLYAPSGDKTLFSYTGANQTYVVPTGVTSLIFKAWGAGGGGGPTATVGGGGGFIEETLAVTPGETLNIKVGGGGVYEGAGASKKGGGGGWTSIDRSGTVLAGAGAGGGGSTTSGTANGGAGGGTTGGSPTGGNGVQATGGTQSAGGSAGTGGGAGSASTGGDAAAGVANDAAGGYNGGGKGDGDDTSWTSGGGGAGYYGGGSGGNSATNSGAGAGGSSLAPIGTNTQASGQTVANAGDADYPGSVGNGGGFAANGQNGYAVIKVLNSMTLIAETQVALAAPTTAHVTLFKEDVDAVTLNTDLLAWVSRSTQTFTTDFATDDKLDVAGLSNDMRVIVTSSGADLSAGLDSETVYYVINASGTDVELSLTSGGAAVDITDDGTGTHSIHVVTQVTLVDEGTYSSYDIIAGSATISGQPSDTDMKLFVQSKNNKNFKLHGQALQHD